MASDLTAASAIQMQAQTLHSLVEAGKTYHQQGQLALAQANYEAVLQQQPDHPVALHYLGVLAYQAKQYEMAEKLMRASIELDPANAFYYSNLGAVYRDQKKLSKAVESHVTAIGLKPDYAEAHLNLAAAQIDQRRFEEGIASCLTALSLRPDYVEAYDNLGTAYRLQHRYADAIQTHRSAISINPSYVGSYVNLAAALLYLKRFDEVAQNCLLALKLNPGNASAYYYLGAACMEQGEVVASERFLRHSLSLNQDNANTHYTLAILLLGTGQFGAGWSELEYRWTKSVESVLKRYYPYPEWQGESLTGKSILIWSEQGIGDQIAFAHLFDDILVRAKHCVFACSKKLIPLFEHSFPDARIVDLEDSAASHLGSIDVQSAAGSLGRWLRPDYASFDRTKPILTVNPERVGYWQQRLASLGAQLKVGICWRSADLTGDRSLYCSQLLEWRAILSVQGVQFINLQYDECSTELEDAYQRFGVKVHVFPEVDLFNDLLESAALTKALDLVISAPTAVSILAGGLDVPVWRLSSGFNWQKRGQNGNIFFGSMRSYTKSWDQGWKEAMDAIADELKLLANVV